MEPSQTTKELAIHQTGNVNKQVNSQEPVEAALNGKEFTSQQTGEGIRTSSEFPSQTGQTSKENQSSCKQVGEAHHTPTSTVSDSPLTPPVTSVQSLVNQLFAVLQQRNCPSTSEAVADSLSDTSSGISSAGTKLSSLSTTSTAESSPVDPRQSVTTPSFPFPSPSLPRSLQSPHLPFPPSPMSPSHSSHTVTTPISGTITRPQLTASGSSPQGGSNNDTEQRPTNEVENEPLVFHNHQSNTKLHTGHNERQSQAKNVSKCIAPHVPFPPLASTGEYMELEPELRPPNPPPFQPGMELRPECPIYQVRSLNLSSS